MRVKNKKNFCNSMPRKEVGFSYGNFAIISNKFAIIILKIGLYRRVQELFKSNQTRYGVSPVYLECKTERIFAIACLGKKLVFHTENREFRD